MNNHPDWDVCLEWGLPGVRRLAKTCDALVIVDVLSFSTCVAIAAANGAAILPYLYQDDRATGYAIEQQALLAGPRRGAGFSLSPASLLALPAGARLVLPSPNGATLSLETDSKPTFAGCLRNAAATARAAQAFGQVGIVPAGERWPDQSLRFALEDFLGAGAIIQALPGRKSLEACAAEAAFQRFEKDLERVLLDCDSGQELVERGFPEDVRLAAELNAGQVAARLVAEAYLAWP